MQIRIWYVLENVRVSDGGQNLKRLDPWFPGFREYVHFTFRTARKYAPLGTKLFYSELSSGVLDTDSDSLFQFLRDLRDKQVPIDGVGWLT